MKTRVYGLYQGVCMHLLKEGARLVVVAYHHHSCSTLAFVVKDPQHNLQDIIHISIYIETYTHTISFGNWNRFWCEFSMLLFWKYNANTL